MILDSTTLFSDAQKITGTTNSTNVIDIGAGRDIGPGIAVPLLCQVSEVFNNLDTLTVSVETADDEAFTAAETLVTSSRDRDQLKLGARFPLSVVPEGTKRFIRLRYVVTGSAPSTGRMTAGIVWGVQSNR